MAAAAPYSADSPCIQRSYDMMDAVIDADDSTVEGHAHLIFIGLLATRNIAVQTGHEA